VGSLFLCNGTLADQLLNSAHLVHDDNKDGNFELEMTWIGPESKGFHEHVPQELLKEAEDAAKRALEEAMEED
jgi:20S proteasome subunit alpha 7